MEKTEETNQLALLNNFILQNPKNSRRTRNKIVVENACFELLYDTKAKEFNVVKKDELFFSIIPYDTSRKYIEKAIFIYLLNPREINRYLDKHRDNIVKYLALSLFQVTGQRFSEKSPEVLRELGKIETDPLFKIQIAGRLLQHDETGPLSATLPYKFLYDFNVKTGIHGYIDELITFYKIELSTLPLSLENSSIHLIEELTTGASHITNAENQLLVASSATRKLKKSELSDRQLQEIKNIRKNYKAHSQHPSQLEQYFDNVHDHETANEINVVSDIHSTKKTIDLISPNFNIIAGDLSDAFARNHRLKGIAVIGNHDIVECGLEIDGLLPPQLMESLKETTDVNYSSIRVDDETLYKTCKTQLEKRFSDLTFLNNQHYTHNGIRYIGLSLPICYIKDRKKVQNYLATVLENLLEKDKLTPTVVITHAPLFNELSLLSAKSKSYQKKFTCVSRKIEALFREYNILGVIHGHHHIPASAGVIEFREFSGKRLFVICSVYSYLNKGFDLQPVLTEIEMARGISE